MTALIVLTLKVSALLTAGLMARRLLRRRSAATRHGVLVAALLGVAVTPLLSAVLPTWNIAAIPAVPPSRIGAAGFTPLQAGEPSFPDAGIRFDWSEGAGLCWLAGATLALLNLTAGSVRLLRVKLESRAVGDGPWLRQLAAVRRAYGLRRPVRLLRSPTRSILVTWGTLRPKVVLPVHSEQWPEERMRAVLCHELAHIRRNDWLIQVGAETLRAILWFNPLVWIVCKRLRLESEFACDDSALAQGFTGSAYGTHLLEILRCLHTGTATPTLAMARPSTIERRFSAMLNSTRDRHPMSRTAMVAAALTTLALTTPLAALNATQQAMPTTTLIQAAAGPSAQPQAAPGTAPVVVGVQTAGPRPAATPTGPQTVEPARTVPESGTTPPRTFSGERITLEMRNSDIRDFFQVISDVSGLNILPDAEVNGRVSVVVKELPWDQVLDVVLRTYRLTAQIEGNALRVFANQGPAQNRVTLQFEYRVNGTLVAAPRISTVSGQAASISQNDLKISVTATRNPEGTVSAEVEIIPGPDGSMKFRMVIGPDRPGIVNWNSPATGASTHELRIALVNP
jgi:beta-lactamase regulating signal transducer with metallopeptidase domain